ncbi:MAG: N-acetyl sugar amidotransferase [Candidatus Omnitrophota bacterium]|jgi:N-acetyl sugar amidotransferase
MEYKVCSRCLIDTTVPGAKFDENGVCSYCKIHDQLDKEYPVGDEGQKRLAKIVDIIKKKGRHSKYDCVVGISGGRDSTYTLYLAKHLGLRPLAVHFNDGFGNPVAGENMKKATDRLNVEMRTVASDWRESKDLKLAFLKASTPEMEEGTDLGIATSLYGIAAKENIKYIILGHSLKTEGISPLEWSYLDGAYLRSVHKKFGTVKLRKWTPEDPGFNLDLRHIFYYTIIKGIKSIPVLNYVNYVRTDAEEIIKKELGWVYPGAHYYDDLYQSLLTYIYRVKFHIDRRRFNYSALIRSGQMSREEAMNRMKDIYVIEDPKVIDLCIKRLGITWKDIEGFVKEPPKTFRDYPTNYRYIKLLRPVIKILAKLNIIPSISYIKYFECG